MEKAWFVNAVYENGRVTLTLLRSDDLQPFKWSDPNYRPYYLVEDQRHEKIVKKQDLFTEQERSLAKIEYSARLRKDTLGWEVDISPSLSYIYDNRLQFGVLHELRDNRWVPQTMLADHDEQGLKNLTAQIAR